MKKKKRENIRDDVELGVAAFLSLNGIYGSSRIWIYCAWFYSWYAATPFRERDDYMTCFCTQDTIKLPENVLQRKTYYNENSFLNYCFIIPKSYQSLNPQVCNIFLRIWYRVISTPLKFFTFNFKHVIPRRSSTLRHKIILIKNFLCWRYDVYCCVCLCVCLIYV